MQPKRFWSPKTIRFLVVFFTLCMLVQEGWVNTAAFYVVILGVWAACRIFAKESSA